MIDNNCGEISRRFFTLVLIGIFVVFVSGEVYATTTISDTSLNVSGIINSTTDIFVDNTTNLTVGYLYATNNTWQFNFSNFTTMYANLLGNTTWNANFTNFTTVYSNLYTNYTGGFDANYTNFTTMYGNLLTNYTNFTTLYTNHSALYTNMSTIIYGYAVNGSDAKNYTNILFNTTFNITNLGYFNFTNATGSLFILNNTGIFANVTLENGYLLSSLGNFSINTTSGYFNITNITSSIFIENNTGTFINGTEMVSGNVTLGSNTSEYSNIL